MVVKNFRKLKNKLASYVSAGLRSMRFVSCLPVSEVSHVEEEVDEIILCETHLSQDDFPSSADGLEQFIIERIVISEGSEIHQRYNCGASDLYIFTEIEKTKYVWYEFLRKLTGHKIYYDNMSGRIEYTQLSCTAPEGGEWSICMELKSNGIVRKIAQLKLYPATQCEVNLFQMANILYQDYCMGNDMILGLKSDIRTLKHRVEELQEERKLLDELIEKRDAKTRSIVVGLVNEKKRKIIELQQRLRDQEPQDSEIINHNIKTPIGRRIPTRKRRLNKSGPVVPLKEIKIKDEELDSDAQRYSNNNQEFNFLGIRKRENNPVKKEGENIRDLLTNSTSENTAEMETSTEDEAKVPDNDIQVVTSQNNGSLNDADEDDEETDVEAKG